MTPFQQKLHAIIQLARMKDWADLAEYTQRALDEDMRTAGGVERLRPAVEPRLLSWQEYANVKMRVWR